MWLSNLLRSKTVTKSSVKTFVPEEELADQARAESAPSSPWNGERAQDSVAGGKLRPATTNEEIRPLCSPAASASHAMAESPPESCTAEKPEGSAASTSDAAASLLPITPTACGPASKDVAASPVTTTIGSCDESLAYLEAPLTQVIANIEDAFGQSTAASLRSSKWDKRVQALKAIGSVLKGLELGSSSGKTGAVKGLRLRDRASCWRATVQALHHSIRDKVMPVRLASHELFCDIFVQAAHSRDIVPEEEVRLAVRSMLRPAIEQLGDSNLRLHESARKCVLVCAELPQLVGLREVLHMLRGHVEATGKSRERAKVHFGVLDTVNFLLGHFPVCEVSKASWSQGDIVPFIVSGMEDSLGPRVRNSAVTLAVTLRATFGAESVESVVAGLRKPVQAVLRDRFAELDDEDGAAAEGADDFVAPSADDMAGLMVCGSRIRAAPPPTPTTHLPGVVSEEDDEDTLMDEILEDAGAVFTGASSALPLQTGRGFAQSHDLTDLGSLLDACDEVFEDGGYDSSKEEEPFDDAADAQDHRRHNSTGTNRPSVVRFNMALEVF